MQHANFFITAFLALIPFLTKAQENDILFKVEYELNGVNLESYAFNVENCQPSTVNETWQSWVKNKGGSTGLLNKSTATNLSFKNSDDLYKSTISTVEEESNKLTVITSLTDQNGLEFKDTSPNFNEIYDKLKDLSFQTRKACVRKDLRFSNDMMIKLGKKSLEKQTRKMNSLKNYIRDNEDILKLETKKEALEEQIDLLENQLERISDPVAIEKIMLPKNKLSKQLQETDSKIEVLTDKINDALLLEKTLDDEITQYSNQLEAQRESIEKLKIKYSQITR